MGDGGKGSGEYRGAGKVPGNYVQVGCPCNVTIWEIKLGVHGRNDEGTGRFLS